MSVFKQIALSLLVIALAAGGWFAFQQRAILFGDSTVATAATGNDAPRAGGGAAPGAPGPGAGRGGAGFGGPALIVAAPVVIDESGQEVRAIGTLAAAQEVTIYPQVTGIVAEIAFTPGSEVAKGAELVRLDDADERIAVDMAEIALTTANAARDRAERLGTTKNITAVDLENARAAAQKAEIDLKAAKLALDKRTITAPFAGVTGLTDLSVGDLATTSKPITTVNDMTSLTVSFDVAERVAGLVAIGQEVDAESDALIGRTIKGRIVAIDNRIDAQARTLKLKASLPNEANILKPGMAITVMLTFPGQPRPSIPSLAVQWDRKGSFVWKVDGDVVHRTPIQIAERRSGVVTVSGELKAGDLVVTEGVLRLREGAKVTIAGDEGNQGGGAAAPEGKGKAGPGEAAAPTAGGGREPSG